MKQTFYQIILTIITIIVSILSTQAQKKDTTIYNDNNVRVVVTSEGDTTVKVKKSKYDNMSISIGTNGIRITDHTKRRKHRKLHIGMHFDFGFNNIVDNTNYNGPLANRNLVAVDTILRPLGSSDLQLNNGRSINFNFWPLWLKQDISTHNVQLETGLGFQFFNFRYSTNVRPVGTSLLDDQPIFTEITDFSEFKGKAKNKFGISYISIPLMLRFNTNKNKGHRFFFGAGVIGSYKLKSWSKFHGQKESLDYGLSDWMAQLSAEIGVTGIIKLYGTYALQSIYRNGLDRQPFAIGIRL